MSQPNTVKPLNADQSRNTGWVPDEPDHRDFIFADLIASGGVSPPTADQPYQTLLFKPELMGQPTLELEDFSTNSPGVYDQGDNMASCVANAIAMAACYMWHQKPGEDHDHITGGGGKIFDPSRWWIWYHARRLAGNNQEHLNVGCNIRNAFKAMHQFGCPPESAWPYPPLDPAYSPFVPADVLQKALQVDPDEKMYNIAKQQFVNDFEYYSIKTIGLDGSWTWGDGTVDPPPEASDRVLQMRTALAEGCPVVFALGEFYVQDTQDSSSNSKWNRNWAPMWDYGNFTIGNIPGGLSYDVIMKDLDPGFFPIDKPRLLLGNRPNGHVMLVIGADATRQLFLCQNSYGLYDDVQKNENLKPYFWMPFNYFRSRFVDGAWVVRLKQGSTAPTPNPPVVVNPPASNQPFVSIDWSDNFSGVDINKSIQANIGPQDASQVLNGTRIGSEGYFTSIQLKGEGPSTVAVVKKDGKILGTVKGSGNDYAMWPRTPLTGVTIELTV